MVHDVNNPLVQKCSQEMNLLYFMMVKLLLDPLHMRNNGGDNESAKLTTNVVTNKPTDCIQKRTS